MNWETGISLVACGLVLVATMLFWNAGIVCGRYDTTSRHMLRRNLMIGGGAVLLAAVVLFVTAACGGDIAAIVVLLFLLCALAAVGFSLSWLQFRASRRQSLVWTLAAAAEKGVPLHDAAYAFADENSGDKQSRNLSLLLHAGAPLPDALRMAHIALPLDSKLAVEAGFRLRLLGPCMQRLLADSHRTEELVREAIERIWYLLALVFVTTVVGSFLQHKIFIVLSTMAAQFGLANPTAGFFGGDSAAWGLSLLLLGVVTALMVMVSAFGGLYYLGLLPTNSPGLGLLARRLDSARMLRVLGAASENEKSLQETLRVLTLFYPRHSVRAKLERAGLMVSAGGNWIVSLMQHGLITAADAAVMESAQRAGNLAWAMDDLASTATRRFSHRLRLIMSVVFPVLTCLAGMMVLGFVLAVFGPLVKIIEAMI